MTDEKAIVKLETVQDKIIDIRGEKVILDSDVAVLYGVETKRINEAVKNNPDKFPKDYIIELKNEEWKTLRSKISALESGGKGEHTKYNPKAFTEKGLYMLATIIKSPKAVQTTLDIIETYARIKDLTRSIAMLPEADKAEQKTIVEKAGAVIGEIIGSGLETVGTDTTIEAGFGFFKIKHSIKREK